MGQQPESSRDEEPINVLIIDDHVAFSDGVAYWLEDHGFRVTTIATIEGLEIAIRSRAPDVALIDLQLPSHDEGLTVPSRVRELSPRTKCLALTGVPPAVLADFVPRAMSASHADDGNAFDGFLTKGMHVSEIAEAIRTTVRHGGFMAPTVVQFMNRRPVTLTDQQKQWLELVKQGKTHKEIAAALCVSVRTSKRLGNRVREKFAVEKTHEALAAALTRKQIP